MIPINYTDSEAIAKVMSDLDRGVISPEDLRDILKRMTALLNDAYQAEAIKDSKY